MEIPNASSNSTPRLPSPKNSSAAATHLLQRPQRTLRGRKARPPPPFIRGEVERWNRVRQRLDAHVAEAGFAGGGREFADADLLLEHAEVAHGCGRHRRLRMAAARLRKQRHPVVSEHPADFMDRGAHVGHVMEGAQTDGLLKRAGPEWQRLHVAGDRPDARTARPLSGRL